MPCDNTTIPWTQCANVYTWTLNPKPVYIYQRKKIVHNLCCYVSLHEDTISRWGLGFGIGKGACSVYMPQGMQLHFFPPYLTLHMRTREYYWYVSEYSWTYSWPHNISKQGLNNDIHIYKERDHYYTNLSSLELGHF